MKLIEIENIDFYPMLLIEGKVDWIEQNQGEKILKVAKERNDTRILQSKNLDSPRAIAEFFVSLNEPYAPYLTKLYLSNQVSKLEDLYKVNELLQVFSKNKRHLQNRDIMSYSLTDLEQVLEPYQGSETTSRNVDPGMDKTVIDNGQAVQIIKTPNFEVYVPLTKDAACYLGKETKWCTAADDAHNLWADYKDDGNIYVIRAGQNRYQLQVESDQFVDVDDEQISKSDIELLSKIPAYKKFLEALIKKHYFNENTIPRYEPKD